MVPFEYNWGEVEDEVAGLSIKRAGDYEFYVACADDCDNIRTDYKIGFSIEEGPDLESLEMVNLYSP